MQSLLRFLDDNTIFHYSSALNWNICECVGQLNRIKGRSMWVRYSYSAASTSQIVFKIGNRSTNLKREGGHNLLAFPGLISLKSRIQRHQTRNVWVFQTSRLCKNCDRKCGSTRQVGTFVQSQSWMRLYGSSRTVVLLDR